MVSLADVSVIVIVIVTKLCKLDQPVFAAHHAPCHCFTGRLTSLFGCDDHNDVNVEPLIT